MESCGIVKLLIDCDQKALEGPIDIEKTDQAGWTPLKFAALYGWPDAVFDVPNKETTSTKGKRIQ